MANLGRVAYVHRGVYDSGALYEKYDVVYESTTNSAYAYINNVATAGSAVTNETYWALLVSGSELNSTAENMPYLFIKYSENEPTTDGEISDTPGDWMGVYVGTSRIAPTTYNSYTWHNITGVHVGDDAPLGTETLWIDTDEPDLMSDLNATQILLDAALAGAEQHAGDASDSANAAAAQAVLAQGYAAQLAAGTASPAGTYADLDALIADNPDNSKIYITMDDGQWCYHNGVAWAAGGVFQAAAIADGSITPQKTDFIRQVFIGKNRYTGLNETPGYLDSDGSIKVYSDWITSDFIDVSGLSNITATCKSGSARGTLKLWFLTTYNAAKGIITNYASYNTSTYAVESGVAYVRFSHHSDIENIQVESGATPTAYGAFIENYRISPSDYVTKGDVDASLSTYIGQVVGKNLYTGESNDVAGYLNSNGVLKAGEDWHTTDYIDVTGLANIVASCKMISTGLRAARALNYMCTYDVNGDFIEQVYTNGPTTYAVEAGVCFVKFCYRHDMYTEIQVESGTVYSSYEAYETKNVLLNSVYSADKEYSGVKWVAIGDSLTERNSRATSNYLDYIASELGFDVVNMGLSGTGYMRHQDINSAFYQRVGSISADADVVTVFGSFNDLGGGYTLGTPTDADTTTICGCINEFFDTFYAAFPAIPIGVILPTPWGARRPGITSADDYVNALISICEARSIPYLDLYHGSNLRPWDAAFLPLCYSRDEGSSVHPDENGHLIISKKIREFLRTLI